MPDSIFKTSIMDDPLYRRCCHLVAQDPNIFKVFRQFLEIVTTIDTVSVDQGMGYLEFIKRNYPYLINQMAEFVRNDAVGYPGIYEYPEIGWICPTTLRYVKTYGDLNARCGDMKGWKIVEIGGGYGGLYRIIASQTPFEKYSIVDLPETLELIKTYLNQFAVQKPECISSDSVEKDISCDLVISNYAFSECQKEVQDKYFDRIIKNSKRGYMMCNYTSHVYGLSSYSSDELKGKLEGEGFHVHIEGENQSLDPSVSNLLFTWWTDA
jgi:hypothetical protein